MVDIGKYTYYFARLQDTRINFCVGAWLLNLQPLAPTHNSLAESADTAEVVGWFTQIIQIDRIICAYLRNLREIISVTRCERSLAESAELAETGDGLA